MTASQLASTVKGLVGRKEEGGSVSPSALRSGRVVGGGRGNGVMGEGSTEERGGERKGKGKDKYEGREGWLVTEGIGGLMEGGVT